METNDALAAFAALGQDTRLNVLRLLVRAGQQGLLAGDIAARLSVRQNTLSSNLSVLARAGLIHGTREGRAVRYRADVDGLRGLLDYLINDCCDGRPDLCAPTPRSLP